MKIEPICWDAEYKTKHPKTNAIAKSTNFAKKRGPAVIAVATFRGGDVGGNESI